MAKSKNSGNGSKKEDDKMSDLFTVITEEELAQKKENPDSEEIVKIDDIDEELLNSILSSGNNSDGDEIDEELLKSILADDSLVQSEDSENNTEPEENVTDQEEETEDDETEGELIDEGAGLKDLELSAEIKASDAADSIELKEDDDIPKPVAAEEQEAEIVSDVSEQQAVTNTFYDTVSSGEAERPAVREHNTSDSESVTMITKGTTINGSIACDCSLDVIGTVNGDIECLGKLTISGKVTGNAMASEVFINTDRFDGNITAEGCVKIGIETVVVGNINAASAVIAGAIRGDMDIKGTVVIDSTAIIKGNIKAKSIQMNNGAVLEGFCSLTYSSVDIDSIFE